MESRTVLADCIAKIISSSGLKCTSHPYPPSRSAYVVINASSYKYVINITDDVYFMANNKRDMISALIDVNVDDPTELCRTIIARIKQDVLSKLLRRYAAIRTDPEVISMVLDIIKKNNIKDSHFTSCLNALEKIKSIESIGKENNVPELEPDGN